MQVFEAIRDGLGRVETRACPGVPLPRSIDDVIALRGAVVVERIEAGIGFDGLD